MVKQIKAEMKNEGLEMYVDRDLFAMSLKTWRLRMGYTQSQVGNRWKCSRYTIMRAEGGKPITWEMAYRLFSRLSDELQNELKAAQ